MSEKRHKNSEPPPPQKERLNRKTKGRKKSNKVKRKKYKMA